MRRVSGDSMLPTLQNGQVIVAFKPVARKVRTGDIVVLHYQNRDIVKRITDIRSNEIYIVGDNPGQSTDSRHFGWINANLIVGKVVWPLRKRRRDT